MKKYTSVAAILVSLSLQVSVTQFAFADEKDDILKKYLSASGLENSLKSGLGKGYDNMVNAIATSNPKQASALRDPKRKQQMMDKYASRIYNYQKANFPPASLKKLADFYMSEDGRKMYSAQQKFEAEFIKIQEEFFKELQGSQKSK